jgi:predicted DCC family thiol-disulfide oxidoreductase YuxK
MASGTEPLGWVLYDGACGFCAWWIPFWRSTIQRCGYEIAPLQCDWVRAKLGPSEPDLDRDILLLLRDGTLVRGADAYIFGMHRVWWSRPLGYLLALSWPRQMTWVFYRWFNRNRFIVSKACRLPPPSATSRSV